MTGELVLTGERTLPDIAFENYWFRRHEVAYRFVLPFVRGARVIDAGCGEGYGATLLATTASQVVGCELDPAVAAHAARRYSVVRFIRGDLSQLPICHGSVEVVVAMQVIEHLADQSQFIAECARVLRPAGTLIVSTPNRLTFSPDRAAPLNPFHTREFAPAELQLTLDPWFDVRRAYGVSHGARLRRWERRHGSLIGAQLAGPSETWPRRVRRVVETVEADDFDVRAEGLDESLDLLFVATRRP